MDEPTTTAVAEPLVDLSFLDKLRHNRLSEAEARQFASQSPEFITFTLLALQQRLAASLQSTGPNTPSAAIPPFAKPNAKPDLKKKSKKKRGGQPGHPGRTREPLLKPDRTRVQPRIRIRSHGRAAAYLNKAMQRSGGGDVSGTAESTSAAR